jgi:hypothetical protein
MELHFRWTNCGEFVPDEIRRVAERRLSRLWSALPVKRVAGGTTADFRLTLDHWTVRYAIELDSHTVVLREARSV